MSIDLAQEFDTRPVIKTMEEALEIQAKAKPREKRKDGRQVVCIVGCAAFSRMLAEEMEPSTHIWSLNDAWKFLRCRVDAYFDIHSEDSWPARETYYAGLRVPVYMQKKDSRVPYSIEYPLNLVTDKHRRFATSSTAYMVALAIHQGFDEIRLLGSDMDKWSEYSEQRPGLMYWLGVAEGAGIEVWLPPGCPLFAEPLYGYENPNYIPRQLLDQVHFEACKVYDDAKAEARKAAGYLEGIKVANGNGQMLQDAEEAAHGLLMNLNTAGGAVQAIEQTINRSGAGKPMVPHIQRVLTEDELGEDPRHRQ